MNPQKGTILIIIEWSDDIKFCWAHKTPRQAVSTIKKSWWHPHCSWQKVASVLHELKGMDYLVAFDYFSRYVKVAGMEKTTKSTEIIRALTAIFATK